jgi:CRP/FNR family transcriptional regulator
MVMSGAAWIDDYMGLERIEPEGRRLLADLPTLRIPVGTVLFTPGAACQGFVFLLSGRVRVGMTGAGGRSIVLYRVEPGETCVQTSLCMVAGETYSAEGVAETDLDVVIAPAGRFDPLMNSSAVFRRFVFDRLATRLGDLLRILETVAFERIDTRLSAVLLTRAGSGRVVEATHQTLADELGTAREVVSRQLQVFANAGFVTVSRGHVTIERRERLAALAAAT